MKPLEETFTEELEGLEFEFDAQVLGLLAKAYSETSAAPVRGLFATEGNRVLRQGSDAVAATIGRHPTRKGELGVVVTIKRGYYGQKTAADDVFFLPIPSLSKCLLRVEGAEKIG